jgi:hypothetical protein
MLLMGVVQMLCYIARMRVDTSCCCCCRNYYLCSSELAEAGVIGNVDLDKALFAECPCSVFTFVNLLNWRDLDMAIAEDGLADLPLVVCSDAHVPVEIYKAQQRFIDGVKVGQLRLFDTLELMSSLLAAVVECRVTQVPHRFQTYVSPQ